MTRSGPVAEVLGAKSLADGDPQAGEQRADRRVDVLIRAGHLVAAQLQHAGERRHGNPADGDEMDALRAALAHGFRDSVH